MSQIHVAGPNGASFEGDLSQVQEQLASGLLPIASLYWTDGMTEWRPVEELLRTHVSEDSTPPVQAPPRTKYAFAKDPMFVTSFLVVMFFVSIGGQLVSLISSAMQLALLANPFTVEAAQANDLRQAVVFMANLAISIATTVSLCLWLYRANANSHGFGAKGMQFTPGWAVGYLFIPILSLFRPYQAVKEIFQVSMDPENWWTAKTPSLLGWWWGTWIAHNSLGFATVRLFSSISRTVADFVVATLVQMAVSLFFSLVCVLGILLVKAIAENQRKLVDMGGPAA